MHERRQGVLFLVTVIIAWGLTWPVNKLVLMSVPPLWAVALRSVNGFRPRFGVPVETMIASARVQGVDPVVLADARLAFDVDRPGDLSLL